MVDNTLDRHPIELLADEFVSRHRSGKGPSVAQFAAEHPEFATDIQELFPLLIKMERLKVESQPSTGLSAGPDLTRIERLLDFKIVREIGRGGMGIVYEAEQTSLKRRVALKVLSKSIASSPATLERFHREAEAAAGLHHTNIVPVYGIGESDDLHFFAMQYINGVGLDAILAELGRPASHSTEASAGDHVLLDTGGSSSAGDRGWAAARGTFGHSEWGGGPHAACAGVGSAAGRRFAARRFLFAEQAHHSRGAPLDGC